MHDRQLTCTCTCTCPCACRGCNSSSHWKTKKQPSTGGAAKAGYFLNVVEKAPLIWPGLISPRDSRHILRAERSAAEIHRPGSCGGDDELLCVAEWQRSSPLWLSCGAAGQEMKLLTALPRARPPPRDAAGDRHENVVAAGEEGEVMVVEGKALQTWK